KLAQYSNFDCAPIAHFRSAQSKVLPKEKGIAQRAAQSPFVHRRKHCANPACLCRNLPPPPETETGNRSGSHFRTGPHFRGYTFLTDQGEKLRAASMPAQKEWRERSLLTLARSGKMTREMRSL